MSKPFNPIYPNQAIALCSRAQAEQLVKYDHHVVQVNGRSGVMLTYEWMPVEEHGWSLCADGRVPPCGATSACTRGDPIHCGHTDISSPRAAEVIAMRWMKRPGCQRP